MQKIIVINPTYNERENIPILVDHLKALKLDFANSNYDLHQLIVDDNSPDGTSELVKNLMKDNSNLHLINGKKQGLGKAYIRGMEYAIKELAADIVVEMDADLQHPPEILLNMVKMLNEDYDFIIASRYIKGGSYPAEWGYFRVLNSKVANILARYIAGLYNIKDCTSGYRVIRVKNLLEKVDFKKINADGYSFQLVLLANVVKKGARVYEYPFAFQERNAGKSKVGINSRYLLDILEFFKNAFMVRIGA